MNKKLIAKRLKTLRDMKGETQEQTASACGIGRNAYASYEAGSRVPRDPVKVVIANHFDVTITELFF